MDEDVKSFKEELKIDKLDLDTEVMRQPFLYAKYSEKLPMAVTKRDMAKLLVERTYAQVDGVVRTVAKEESIKLTEKEIEARIKSDETYQETQDAYYKAKEEASLCEVAKHAFEQRKDMLEALIKLHNSGYWSEVKQEYSEDAKKHEASGIKKHVTKKDKD